MGDTALVVLEETARLESEKEMPSFGVDQEGGIPGLELHDSRANTVNPSPITIEMTTTQTTIRTNCLFCILVECKQMRGLLRLFGIRDPFADGVDRTLRGLRTGDQRQLYLGLGLAAFSYLSRTAPRKRLIYRKAVPEGSAIVIHHKRVGDPKIEVIRPG
jgi:hypothetical protein